MFGRLLCWFGWHDWGYVDGHRSFQFVRSHRPTRKEACQLNDTKDVPGEYRCVRCGEWP